MEDVYLLFYCSSAYPTSDKVLLYVGSTFESVKAYLRRKLEERKEEDEETFYKDLAYYLGGNYSDTYILPDAIQRTAEKMAENLSEWHEAELSEGDRFVMEIWEVDNV